MIPEKRVEQALMWLVQNADAAAKATAEKEYMAEWIGTVRATIAARLIEAGESATAADIKAKASQDYKDALAGYREAVEAFERLRWRRTSEDAVIEVWRSQQANARAMEKVR